MSAILEQVFPRQEHGRIVHKSFTPDLNAAHDFVRCRAFTAERLLREVTEMATHFPRWLLTLGVGRETLACRGCGGLVVFERGARCVLCGREVKRGSVSDATNLAWFGLMPPIGVDGLGRLKESLAARAAARHVVGRREDIGTYLLVPLVAAYHAEYPANAPSVCYLPGIFSIPGMPPDTTSHAYHLFGHGQMCLFASGQWSKEMTVRDVLQQRAYAHVVKLLNYADGKKTAFQIVS